MNEDAANDRPPGGVGADSAPDDVERGYPLPITGGGTREGGLPRRRRGGVSGTVLAELRELAGSLGVSDTTGMRRGDLIAEIKRREEAKVVEESGVEVILVDTAPEGAEGGPEEPTQTPVTPPPPPPARLLSAASLLLAPSERENWLGELRTARWEARGDSKQRRRVTWTFGRDLGASLVASWRTSVLGLSRPENS